MHTPRVAEAHTGVTNTSPVRPCQVRKRGGLGIPHPSVLGFSNPSQSPSGTTGEASISPENQPWAVDLFLVVQVPQADDLYHLHQVHKHPRNLSKGKISPREDSGRAALQPTLGPWPSISPTRSPTPPPCPLCSQRDLCVQATGPRTDNMVGAGL